MDLLSHSVPNRRRSSSTIRTTRSDASRPLLGEPQSRSYDSTRNGSTRGANTDSPSDDEEGGEVESMLNRKPTPLPKLQIAVLLIMRISEPIAFLSILPFLPKMLRDNMPGIPREQIGYYAGLVESVFALVQFATVFLWGRASDRIGRKPVMLIGLAGVAVSTNAFGLAKTLPQMIIARSIAGLMNANVSVLKSILGELTDETNQARAFSFLPLCFAAGSIIGPAMSAALSDPADTFPVFEHSKFLQKYPYWLPCFCASLFNIAGFVAGFFFLKETLPGKQQSQDRNDDDEQGRPESPDETAPTLRQLLTRPVILALANSAMMNFMNIVYIAVLPLFCDTPLELGGLSMSKQKIGYYLAGNGFVTIVTQLVAFPRLERRWGGPLPTLQKCLVVLPGVFIMFIVAHYAAKSFGTAGLITSLGVLLLIRGVSSMMVVSSNLCVNNVVPHHAALGTINGLSQSLASLARAIGPIFSTSSFAFSISHLSQFLDGQVVWLMFSAISLVTWWISARMDVPRMASWRKP